MKDLPPGTRTADAGKGDNTVVTFSIILPYVQKGQALSHARPF